MSLLVTVFRQSLTLAASLAASVVNEFLVASTVFVAEKSTMLMIWGNTIVHSKLSSTNCAMLAYPTPTIDGIAYRSKLGAVSHRFLAVSARQSPASVVINNDLEPALRYPASQY